MKKLLISILTIGVVSTVAIGATRAFFTDQATVLGNSISTGTLDLALRDKDDQTFGSFTLEGLVPGQLTTPIEFRVRNTTLSSAPIKYQVYDGNEWENATGLYDKIYVTVGTSVSAGDVVSNPVYSGPLRGMYFNNTSGLGIGQNHTYYLQFWLHPTAGNQFKGKSAGFRIIVDATQLNSNTWN